MFYNNPAAEAVFTGNDFEDHGSFGPGAAFAVYHSSPAGAIRGMGIRLRGGSFLRNQGARLRGHRAVSVPEARLGLAGQGRPGQPGKAKPAPS